jgi:hypothetical protein
VQKLGKGETLVRGSGCISQGPTAWPVTRLLSPVKGNRIIRDRFI